MRVNPVRTKVLITNGCLNHHHSMMPRRAAIGTYTLVLIAIIAVAAISIVFVASQSSTTSTTTQSSSLSQSTITSHPPATSTTSVSSSNGNTTSTICVVNVEGAGTYLQIVSDSTQQPLSGISVSVLPTASSCLGYPPIPGPETYTTNATGWVSMGGLQANYYFETSLTYTGRNYSFVLPQGPIETTNATLSLPSGTLSISLCNATGTKTCYSIQRINDNQHIHSDCIFSNGGEQQVAYIHSERHLEFHRLHQHQFTRAGPISATDG